MLVPKINGLPLFQPQVIFKRKIYFLIISRLFECYLNFILAETNNPQAELEGAFKFLGPVDKKFIYVQDVFQPKADNPADNVRFRFSFFWVTWWFFRFSSRNPTTQRRILRPPVKISWRSTSRSPAKISTFPPARSVSFSFWFSYFFCRVSRNEPILISLAPRASASKKNELSTLTSVSVCQNPNINFRIYLYLLRLSAVGTKPTIDTINPI